MGLNHHQIKTTLALALVLDTIAPAQASARFELNRPQSGTTPSQPAVQIVRVSTPGGFDWGDAGIGAAGALGLSTLAIGSGLVIGAKRHRTPGTPDPGHRATPHPRTPGDLSRRPDSKTKSVSDQREAIK